MSLTPEEQAKFDKVFETMASDGWKILMADVAHVLDQAVTTCSDMETEKDFFVRKGNIQTLRWLANIENIWETVYQQRQEEDDEDASV